MIPTDAAAAANTSTLIHCRRGVPPVGAGHARDHLLPLRLIKFMAPV